MKYLLYEKTNPFDNYGTQIAASTGLTEPFQNTYFLTGLNNLLPVYMYLASYSFVQTEWVAPL